MSDLSSVAAFPVGLVVASRATAAQLLKLAKDRAPVPDAIDPDQTLFWTVLASNNKLDAYSTRMAPSTLQNFTNEAKAGVSFQDGHLTDGAVRTLGQSLMARYSGPNAEAGGPGVAQVEIDFFGQMGIDPSTDATLRKMQAGIIRDVSVGFYLGPDGMYRCSICDRDMFDYSSGDWCPHLPGFKYAVYGPDGKPTDERVVATADIENGHLAETSTVYDGATPGASILAVKARQLSDAGTLEPERALLLESRYRINLPGAHRAYTGFTAPQKEVPVPEKATAAKATETTATTPESFSREQVNQMTADRARAVTASVVDELRAIGVEVQEGADVLEVLRGLGPTLVELRAKAKDGEEFRKALLDEAITEGKRAHGVGYDEKTYRGLLESASIDSIRRYRDDQREIAAKVFPGKRQTTDRPAPAGKEPADEGEVRETKNGLTKETVGAYRTRY